jgi:glycosyl transferase, family 25
MLIHVINLDRTPERWEEFQRVNAGLPGVEFQRFVAVDGIALDSDELVRRGLIDTHMARIYSKGAIGNVLSHVSLWDEVTRSGEAMTIAEDDAILNGQFAAVAESFTKGLALGWDIILWGWIFRLPMEFEIIPGVHCASFCNQAQMRTVAGRFRELALAARPFRLLRAFGTVCYTISPAGIAKLRPRVLPIRFMTVPVSGYDQPVPNEGIDTMMCGAYPQINAVVGFPALVLTLHDAEASTIHGPRAG